MQPSCRREKILPSSQDSEISTGWRYRSARAASPVVALPAAGPERLKRGLEGGAGGRVRGWKGKKLGDVFVPLFFSPSVFYQQRRKMAGAFPFAAEWARFRAWGLRIGDLSSLPDPATDPSQDDRPCAFSPPQSTRQALIAVGISFVPRHACSSGADLVTFSRRAHCPL